MNVSCLLFLACAFLQTALADIEFTDPVTGSVLEAGHVVTAHWKDSGTSPRISDLVQYDLYLCALWDAPGADDETAFLIQGGVFARGNSVSFEINPDVSGDAPEAYYLKMVASGPDVLVVRHSGWFTLTGMAGHDSVDFMSDDRAHQDLRKRQAVGAYTIPYQLQSGPTKYAPMAKKPRSTIPARSSPTPQFPTSAYSVATAYLPAPTVKATLSAARTYSVVSVENTASPAPHPDDAEMEKFLARWKD
ncbi:putative beta-1,6-glucan boisynthesis protein [Aspergillus steynii IBT 23096]|uniref:Putative beta-1,6-glucan boisynthesis protein n=1 Tax=Aspergillus steynii IBT 23096 TaxID=1392250 RepID=A0A2I2G2D6_9EURO|nr:putative beta-1,6-glucan boisynthesis protein [Aspergillus steynii IBT 23096]PLB47025.1 putative beta-1,6-glucan boisynthesis protein [Aspergillus steynii IBT 23096]